MRWVVVVFLGLSVLLAGCTLDEGGDPIDEGSPATILTVTSVSERPGSCFSDSGFGDGYCHEITTLVDNRNNRKDFSTNMFNWDARDENGAVFDAPDVEGPDGIASEGQATITLNFDIDSENVNLTRLHYKTFGLEYWADIPPY